MNEILKINQILEKVKKADNDFSFRTKLQVIKHIKKYTSVGKPYLSITFRDVTGELSNFIKWTNNEEEYQKEIDKFEIGNIIEFTGKYKVKYGSTEISEPKILDESEVNLEDFTEISKIDPTSLIGKIEKIILTIQNANLRKLLDEIFSMEDIRNKYIFCPSSIIHHHNYKHGNIEHTVGMINIFDQLVNYYKKNTLLDIDLIYSGIILHDIGKIFEFSLVNDLPMKTVDGKIYGHIILGDQYIARVIKSMDNFPKDLENKIRHMILSHHGKLEWDSLIEPQFPEAELLHLLDMIDSRFKLTH